MARAALLVGKAYLAVDVRAGTNLPLAITDFAAVGAAGGGEETALNLSSIVGATTVLVGEAHLTNPRATVYGSACVLAVV